MNQVEISGIAAAGLGPDSRSRCERVLTLMHTHRGDPLAEVERLLADDPTCLSAHSLRAALLVLADDDASRAPLAASVAAIEAAGPELGGLDRRHAAAARAWIEADPLRALDRYAAIVVDYPRDILALLVAHALDFRLGKQRMLRDRVARVLPEWDATDPGYASVLAMHAFGLEENGQYRLAEKTARRALMLDPGHPGAIHVVAHVMEMQGRARDGLAWLAETAWAWTEGTGFSVHLAWHRGLFQLDLGDAKAALATYDTQIACADLCAMPALVDASALLWRLELRGADTGARWAALARRWDAQSLHGVRAFYLVHAMMAFVGAGWNAECARVMDLLHRASAEATSTSSANAALATPLCEALVAFGRRRYAACVEHLTRVRHLAQRCGGSVAQCDLIHLTMTEAALRARQTRLAHALVTERTAQKPASRLNRLLLERALTLVAASPA